ncbi:hypothetical protein E3N88_12648 [Mikania micrantha]|uniref:Uncharacterized protein n=1 Tax=Mikania micrantha TaxID=192012 RepID=A0A5N6P7G2_9ASTR|nr:hypothetical protein E3N88_12648 [Mikania micrantha]
MNIGFRPIEAGTKATVVVAVVDEAAVVAVVDEAAVVAVVDEGGVGRGRFGKKTHREKEKWGLMLAGKRQEDMGRAWSISAPRRGQEDLF